MVFQAHKQLATSARATLPCVAGGQSKTIVAGEKCAKQEVEEVHATRGHKGSMKSVKGTYRATSWRAMPRQISGCVDWVEVRLPFDSAEVEMDIDRNRKREGGQPRGPSAEGCIF